MAFEIRPAYEHDFETVVEIIRNAFRDVAEKFHLTADNARSHPSNYTVDRLQKDVERGAVYFVIEQDGSPVGCVAQESASSDVCYLERLAVLPAARHQGCGRLLVDHVLDNASKLGARQVSIGVIAEQTELTDWYRSIGFVLTETKTFPHLPFTVAYMIFDLARQGLL